MVSLAHSVTMRCTRCILVYALLDYTRIGSNKGKTPEHKSIAKCAGKDYRDGAVVPFE